MIASGIYRIRNTINGRVYIGSAINLKRRKQDHFKDLRGGYHGNLFLRNAWAKYGEQAFEFEILEYVHDPTMLISAEQRYLDEAFAKATRGTRPYNICPVAGSQLGTRHTPESIEKMAAAKRGRKIPPEVREKMSQAMKGRIRTAEHQEKLAKARTGILHTAETKARISAVKTGMRYHTEEHKAKMSAIMRGRKMPVGHGEKLREAHRSLTKEQVAEIVRLRKEGATYIELAKQFNSTKDTVRNWCMKEGLEQKNPYLTKAQVTEIKMRRADGQTYDQIAEAMGISKVTIWYKVGKKHAQPEPLLTAPEPTEPDLNQLSLL